MGKPDFTGTWELEKTENIDDFLKAQNFNWLTRKAIALFLGGKCKLLIKHSELSEDLNTLEWLLEPVPPPGQMPTLIAGGETVEDKQGVWSAEWEGDVFVVKKTEGKTPPAMYRRYMEDGKIMMV